MKAVIPAAGLGTRFLPATKTVPKELLPVLDVPALQLVVEEALAAGLERVVLVLSPGKRALVDHFGPDRELVDLLRQRGLFDAADRVAASARTPLTSVEQLEPLGLGHAVLAARAEIGDEPFAVLLPDDIYEGPTPAIRQLLDRHAVTGRSVAAIEEVALDEVSRYGIVRPGPSDGAVVKVLDVIEKPHPREAPSRLAVMGRYVLTPDVFAWLERATPGAGGEIQLTDALRHVAAAGRLEGLAIQGTRLDAGEPLGLLKAGILRALQQPDLAPRLREFLGTLRG